VPLDPDYPEERLAYMIQNSWVGIILTQEKLRHKLSSLVPAATRLITLDGQWPEINSCISDLKAQHVQLQQQVRPHHLAYVIYTSGSTGNPKGVMVEHQSVVNHNLYARRQYQITSADRQLQFSSISFDLFVEEVFVVLASGAQLVLEQKDKLLSLEHLGKLIEERKITTLNVPTAFFHELVASSTDLHGIKTVIVGGEELAYQRARVFKESFPDINIHNTYGPTEATIISAATCVTGDLLSQHASVPIGSPIANTQIYILDGHNNVQPVGVPGELHIAGDGLARGYLNRPELTEEKFVANPFAPGKRMYKTGDLARWLEDGNIQYMGRIDTQVKIRGFRIELGEIEACLNQHPGIRDSAVIAQGGEGNRQLIAFYRAKETTAERIVELPIEELRAYLQRSLPEYMMPAGFMSLAAIPLNANGKVDRRALARMDVTIASTAAFVGPENETEKQLVEIWAQVLNREPEKIGVNDNFFELGGHSLSAVQLMAKMNRHFNQLLPLAAMFTAPNIRALAKLISSKEAVPVDILVPMQTNGDALPIFGVPGAGGNVFSLQPLSKAFGSSQPFYGLQPVGLDGKTSPLDSVEQTAKANIAALKAVQPHGPYTLVGHSYGGVVAFEMARMLLEQAEQISSLILLDSLAPSVMQERDGGDDATDLFDACTEVANLHGATLAIDLERLRQSSSEENVQYVVELLNGCGIEINGEQFSAFYRVYQANLGCYRAYRPSMLAQKIDVALYRATQGHEDGQITPVDCGWNQLLAGPVRVHDVEANHFSMLEEPHIEQIAGALGLPSALAASY
jgi:amino acid adenylation domain-containing protein